MKPATPEELAEARAEGEAMLAEARQELGDIVRRGQDEPAEVRAVAAGFLRRLAAEIVVLAEGLET